MGGGHRDSSIFPNFSFDTSLPFLGAADALKSVVMTGAIASEMAPYLDSSYPVGIYMWGLPPLSLLNGPKGAGSVRRRPVGRRGHWSKGMAAEPPLLSALRDCHPNPNRTLDESDLNSKSLRSPFFAPLWSMKGFHPPIPVQKFSPNPPLKNAHPENVFSYI